MLQSNSGKFVRYSKCGKYVLVVFSKPLGWRAKDYFMYALKAVGKLQQYSDLVFSPFQASGRDPEYFGNEAPQEIREKHNGKLTAELVYYEPLLQGWTSWENAAKYVKDGEQKIEFNDVPTECPLVDGDGWNRAQSPRNRTQFLSVRETPWYNKDVKWNHFASKSGKFPFHYASFGYENYELDQTTSASHGMVGHLGSFRNNFELTDELLLDPTLREELRIDS